MKIRRIRDDIRNEIGKRYVETEITRDQLVKDYKLSKRTISNIIKEYRMRLKLEANNGE